MVEFLGNDKEGEKIMDSAEVCKEFGMSIPTLIKYRKEGLIPFFNIGNRVRFKRKLIKMKHQTNSLPKTTAGKLQMLMDLMKRKEIHKCDKCDHEHEVEIGFLEPEEVLKELNAKKTVG